MAKKSDANEESIHVYPETSVAEMSRLKNVGRIQFCDRLTSSQIASIAKFCNAHPATELRIFSSLSSKTPYDNLRVLSEFEGLKRLTIELVHAKNFDAVSRFADSLESLTLGPTNSKGIDFSFLEELKRLNTFKCTAHQAALGHLGNLKRLKLVRLSKFKFAEGMENPLPKSVRQLELYEGTSSSLGWIAGIENLRYLALVRIKIKSNSVAEVGKLEKLVGLRLDKVAVAELPNLYNLSRLKYLMLSGLNKVMDLRGLEKLPVLKELCVQDMPQLSAESFGKGSSIRRHKNFRVNLGKGLKSSKVTDEVVAAFDNANTDAVRGLLNWPTEV